MSVSNYVLNQRISVLQSEIDNLTPPSGGYVPVNGNITINDIKTFSTLPQSSVVPVSNDDLVNKLYVDTHGGGGSQNLSQVLTTGNSAGSSSINMNTNAISAISTATAKTSLVVDNSVVGANATLTQSNLTINATGLSNASVLTLNQSGVGNGILIEEIYNQRTAQTGEFNRTSFYAKNSAGTKTEYGRIHQNAPVITAGAVKGRMDFAVGNGAGLQDYLSLNANTSQVDILNSNLHLNSNDIVNVNTISTPIANNYYAKQITPVILNANTTLGSANAETYARYTAFNAGRTATWDNSNINDFSSAGYGVENITASVYGFNSYYWVVGTESGNIFYSSDNGSSWTFAGGVGGRINCMTMYNSNSNIAIGGNFTGGTYNYLCGLNSGWSLFDMTPSLTGLNGAVNCFFDDQSHFGILQIGGAFTDFYGGSGNFYGFVAYNWNTSGYNPLNNYSGGGFTGGEVRSIAYDVGSSFLVVGGTFTTEDIGSGGIGIPYLYTFTTFDGYSVGSYFSIGVSLNNPVYSVIPYSSGLLIGGDFNNTAGVSFCNTNYGINIIWDGVSSWNLYDYPIYNPSANISSIVYIPYTGVYYTIQSANTIFSGATQLPTPIPSGSSWNCILYNGGQTYFATNGQTSAGFILYTLNNSLVVSITSTAYNIATYSGTYTICNLLGFGSSVELMYISGLWWVVSQNGCSFS